MTTYRPPAGSLRGDAGGARDAATRRIGAVVWPSFFAAAMATMVFFAIVDPIELATIMWPRVEMSRLQGYSIGFFMFWLCTLSACAFTALLMQPPKRPDRRGARRTP